MAERLDELADRVRIGTSGWSYPAGEGRWTGVVYPSGTRSELGYYAAHLFNTVELNVSFYRLIPPAMAGAWLPPATVN